MIRAMKAVAKALGYEDKVRWDLVEEGKWVTAKGKTLNVYTDVDAKYFMNILACCIRHEELMEEHVAYMWARRIEVERSIKEAQDDTQ